MFILALPLLGPLPLDREGTPLVPLLLPMHIAPATIVHGRVPLEELHRFAIVCLTAPLFASYRHTCASSGCGYLNMQAHFP